MSGKMVVLPPCSFCNEPNSGFHAVTPGLKPACHPCYKKIRARKVLEGLVEVLGADGVKEILNGNINKQKEKN